MSAWKRRAGEGYIPCNTNEAKKSEEEKPASASSKKRKLKIERKCLQQWLQWLVKEKKYSGKLYSAENIQYWLWKLPAKKAIGCVASCQRSDNQYKWLWEEKKKNDSGYQLSEEAMQALPRENSALRSCQWLKKWREEERNEAIQKSYQWRESPIEEKILKRSLLLRNQWESLISVFSEEKWRNQLMKRKFLYSVEDWADRERREIQKEGLYSLISEKSQREKLWNYSSILFMWRRVYSQKKKIIKSRPI